MRETNEEQAKRLDAYAELCYGDSPVVRANREAFRAGAAALRAQGEDDAEWWRQVAQGLSVEIAKLKSERPRRLPSPIPPEAD